MYSGMKKGLRCRICTGCGLCPGVVPGMGRLLVPPGERERSREAGAQSRRNGSREADVLPGAHVGQRGDRPDRMHVLAGDALGGERIPFPRNGKRLAVADIGTTTIAMLLYGEDGRVEDRFAEVNPQTVYGADVISRIKAAEDPAAAIRMKESVRETLSRGLKKFQKRLPEGEELYLTVAANTTMSYLFMGWDTAELGQAPFRASRLSGGETELEGVRCFLMPGFSAFVGGDILAGCCACGIGEREAVTLLIDLGTNGELLLGNCHRRIACATAAGPAFEGGASRGVWGADMVRFLAVLRREGFLDQTGLLAEPYFGRGIRIGNVLVTRDAVRSVQLAKAAIAAGIEVLLGKYGIGSDGIDRVVLAGGFGYYLDPRDAVEIGLLPHRIGDKTVPGGNTALAGALTAGRGLLGRGWDSTRLQLEKYREGTEVVNLAEEPVFGELYIQRMELQEYFG